MDKIPATYCNKLTVNTTLLMLIMLYTFDQNVYIQSKTAKTAENNNVIRNTNFKLLKREIDKTILLY